jgi:two-component system NtrC family sensor kinase
VTGPLAVVGAVARLLNTSVGAEETLAQVADALRQGLPADSVMLWFRKPGTVEFTALSSPSRIAAPVSVQRLDDLPSAGAARRISIEHDGSRYGVLEALVPSDAARLETLTVVADLLAPFLASLELSVDLAGEVATQSREIEEHRRFTSLVIDSLPVGLYVVDRSYRIQAWNRKRETGTQGLRRDDVLGRPVFEVLTRQPPDQLKADFDRVFHTGEIQQSEQEVTLGGERRWFRLSKIPMRLEGDAITHVITIGEDVTGWHVMQKQILQAEKLAAIGQLAAGIMHEINNPLATISACVAAIQGAPDSSPDEYLEIIDREVARCSRITDSLLDFSRPKATTKKGPVGLNELVEQALSLLRHHRRFKRLEVVRDLDPKAPRTIGEAEQLLQVLMALMLNAVDAMEPSGGRLTVRSARTSGEGVVLEVTDTGAGIAGTELSKIFEPFYTTKSPGRGTGLGLSICYGIVTSHGGRIEVDSVPGQGSTFRILLPAAP